MRRSTEPLVLVGPEARLEPRPTFTDVLACVDESEPAARIASELADPLVVVGTHDHREVEHPALGGVSLAVVRHSPHPVLVVPTHTHPDPETVVTRQREST